MKTASFHTTARKAILATLQTNRDDLRDHAPVLRVQPESSCDRPGA